MSRCFPFPPPGYERKHTPEDLDLLKEAKRKEKKHKKEKKDKERKKDKEKKEKDGSVEKQKDKKDRKEKHKDKKDKHKDKRKDKEDWVKDKEKSSISEEATTVAGKLHQIPPRNDRSRSSNDGKCFALFQGQNGGKPSQSSLPSFVNDESKFVRELDRRIIDEKKGKGSQLPEKVVARNSSGPLVEEKVDNKNKKIERKLDPQGLRNDYSGNTMVQNVIPMARSKVEGPPKLMDEQNGRRLEDRERNNESVKWGDKQKDRDKESQAKEKDREKKKEDKVKIKPENKKSSCKDDGRNDPGTGNQSANLLNDLNKNAANEAIIRKRKDTFTNGFLHGSVLFDEIEIRPNKISRPSPHQLTENGRKLEPSQTPTKSPHALIPQGVQVDSKDRVMNGMIEAQKPSLLKPKTAHHDTQHSEKPSKVPKIEDLIAEASRRPPHPDSKYLVEVLTVPKMEDWPGCDNQEWLFSQRGSSSKPVGPVRIEEDARVWSEAMHIESADVFALPYVIPY